MNHSRAVVLAFTLAAASNCVAATKFVWAHSDSPATGLSILVKAAGGGKSLTTDPAGESETIAAGSEITVHDPETGLDLLIISAGAPIANPIRVPEPIRLSGRVAGGAGKPVFVQFGFGERVTPIERLRRLYDRYIMLEPGANTLFGIELPKSALRWGNAQMEPDGRYLTPFFPAEDPQVFAHNTDRAVGFRDAPLPRQFRARATIDVAPLTLTPTRTLRVNYDAPATAVAVDAQIFLKQVRIDPQRRESVARLLSVLDRIDPRLLVFATGLRPYNLSAGQATITGLPEFDEIDVHVMGALTSQGFDRTLRLEGASAEISFSSADVLPTDGKAPLKGVVVVDGSYAPVKNANVVYSCYPEKIEVKTNDDGEFGIPAACSGRDITVFVTATDWIAPPRFAPAQIRRRIRPGQGTEPVVIAIPAAKRARTLPRLREPKPPDVSAATLSRNRSSQKSYYAPIRESRVEPWLRGQPIPPGGYYLAEDEELEPAVYVSAPGTSQVNTVVDIRWVDPTHVDVIVTQSGVWQVLAARGALIIGGNDAVEFVALQPKRVEIFMLKYFKSLLVVISAYAPKACSNCAVYISNPAMDPDPTEIDTTSFGVADLEVLDNNNLHVFVADKRYGYYDCLVKLDFRHDVDVYLLKTPDTPCPPSGMEQLAPPGRAR
jgi:hypothetical protein